MAASTGNRIVFTGGSGKAGRHVIPYLLSKGHSVLNLDLVPLPHPSVYTLKTDLTDAGQVFNAFTSNFHINDYSNPRHSGTVPVGPIDGVIHFAAYARNMLVPDNECFKGNVLSTYNVIEAACKLGVKKVIIASSETTYGVCFSQGDSDYHSFPLEEDYDCGNCSLTPPRPSCVTDHGCGRSNGYLRNKQALWRALRQEFRKEVSRNRHICTQNRQRDRTT